MTRDVYVLIPAYRNSRQVVTLIQSLLYHSRKWIRKIVVWHDGDELHWIAQTRKLLVERGWDALTMVERNSRNQGYGRAIRSALQRFPFLLETSYLLVSNQDVVLCNDAVGALIEFMERYPRVGLATCFVEGIDGRFQPVCQHFPNLWRTVLECMRVYRVDLERRFLWGAWFSGKHEVFPDWIWGTFVLWRTSVCRMLGGTVPVAPFHMYHEDLVWGWVLRKLGWLCGYTPNGRVLHQEGGSGFLPPSGEKRQKLARQEIHLQWQLWGKNQTLLIQFLRKFCSRRSRSAG